MSSLADCGPILSARPPECQARRVDAGIIASLDPLYNSSCKASLVLTRRRCSISRSTFSAKAPASSPDCWLMIRFWMWMLWSVASAAAGPATAAGGETAGLGSGAGDAVSASPSAAVPKVRARGRVSASGPPRRTPRSPSSEGSPRQRP